MEDLLILLLQGLAQIAFEILAYLPWDWAWYAYPYNEQETADWKRASAWIFSLIAGALLGWGSLHYFPDVFVQWGWLRIVLLFLTPLGSGFLALAMARGRQEKNELVSPLFHFWLSLCFSAGFIGIRFAFAHRLGN